MTDRGLDGAAHSVRTISKDNQFLRVMRAKNSDLPLHSIALMKASHDALLIGWAALPSPQNGVSFNAGSSQYSAGAEAARLILTGIWGWAIVDGGPAP